MRSRTTIAALLITSALWATPASAEIGRQFEAEIGAGQLDEDWLLTTRLGFLWFDEVEAVGCRDTGSERCVAPVRAALNLPIRLEIDDAPPSDDELVRMEDWDDVGDFLRIARFLQYGEKWQPLYARTGELGPIVLGHGTIANGYLSTITTGAFDPGVELAVNTVHGGLQIFLNDYTQPRVLGLRGQIRPFAKPDADGFRTFGHRFAVGVSAVSDFAAPQLVGSGDALRGEPEVADSSPLTIAGLDVELAPVDNDTVEWLTYADVNLSLGAGAHLGSSLRIAFDEDWSASLRLEGRVAGRKYIPDYFGPLYHVDRYQFGGYGTPTVAPKARIAASQTEIRYGGYGQLDVAWRELLAVSLATAEHSGAGDTSAWARVSVTPPGPFSMGVYWANLNRESGDIFSLDGSLIASEARVTVWGPLYVHGRYDRLFRLTPSGVFTAAVEWNAGVGAAFGF